MLVEAAECLVGVTTGPRYFLRVNEPSSAQQATDDADEPASRDPSKETRADRIRRRVTDHPVGAFLVVAVGVLGALGGMIGGTRQIVGLFDDSGGGPVATLGASLDPSELKTAKNSRYGFSFNYPVTWQRQDPVNGDGLAAIGPEPGLELTAFGRLPTLGPAPSDVFERLEYQVRQLAEARSSRIVEVPNQQNVTRLLPGGESSEVAGSRFVMETDADEGMPPLTTVALVTTTLERDVEMLCTVPTQLDSAWRGACNQLLSTLILTR